MEERWVKIKDFPYMISDNGRIASLKRGFHILSETNSKGGYLSVVLTNGKKTRYTRIHRLVYEAFVGEIPEGSEWSIHHLDGNKQNNCASNLELMSCKEHHHLHFEKNPHLCDSMINYNKNIRPKKVAQYSLDGSLLGVYNNAKDASRCTNVCSRNILQVAGGEPYNSRGLTRKQAGGYIWKFVN